MVRLPNLVVPVTVTNSDGQNRPERRCSSLFRARLPGSLATT